MILICDESTSPGHLLCIANVQEVVQDVLMSAMTSLTGVIIKYDYKIGEATIAPTTTRDESGGRAGPLCRAQCPGGPWTRRTASPAARGGPAGTSQSSTWGQWTWLHDSDHNLQSVASSPDIVLMVGFIMQVVGGPELFPHRGAPALKERVDGILIVAIHLQITCSVLKKLNLLSILTSVLANISKLARSDVF